MQRIRESRKQDLIKKNLFSNTKKKKQIISQELIVLNQEQITAFEQLKKALITATELRHPIPNTPKIIEVDASAVGYGGVLYQIVHDQRQMISLVSGTFNTIQATKDTYSYELEGAYQTVKKLSRVIEASVTTLYTDNRTLIGRFNGHRSDLTSYELRRLNYLTQYVDRIVHIPGKRNNLADHLSRNRYQDVDRQINNIYLGYQVNLLKIATEQTKYDRTKELLRDPKFKYRTINVQNKLYFLVHREKAIYVPPSMEDHVIQAYHATAHQSARIIQKLMIDKFWFPKMQKKIKLFVQACTQCQRTKVTRYNTTPLTQIQVDKKRFNVIHIDIVGPLLPTANYNQYVLTIIDHYTKFLTLIPIQDQSSENVSQTLVQHYIKIFGIPSVIISDNGNSFTAASFTKLLNDLQIKHVKTTPYHPQTNGLLERQHRKVKDSIRCLSDLKLQWDTLIPVIQLSWNNCSMHQNIYSPAQIVFGQDMILPYELFNRKSTDSLDQPTDKQIEQFLNLMYEITPHSQEHHDKRKLFRLKGMQTCEAVYVKNHNRQNKLQPTYRGPFKVIRKFEKYFEVQINDKVTKISIQDLKPSFEINVNNEASPLVLRDEILEEQTKRMMDERRRAMAKLRATQHIIEQRILEQQKNPIATELNMQQIKEFIDNNPNLVQQFNSNNSIKNAVKEKPNRRKQLLVELKE